MMTMTTENNYVEVVWFDAHAVTESWTPVDELDRENCVVRSVGMLMDNVKEGHLVLAQSMICGQDTVDNVLAIPAGMVRQVNPLTLVKFDNR